MDTVTVRSDQSVGRSNTEVLAQGLDSQPTLRLRLKKPKGEKKVGWREGTVDNEHMNKKKSKCCCIYKKPVAFGESSSEDEEDCENCFGHPEKRKKNRKHDHSEDADGDGATCSIHKPTAVEPPQPQATPPDSNTKKPT